MRSGRRKRAAQASKRQVDYHNLRNPFPLMPVFSEDRIAAMHADALRLLQEHGMKVLLPQARALYARGGAKVDEDMVFISADMVEQALSTAPPSIRCRAGIRQRDMTLELGSLVFQAGAGAPNATDRERGRRPGCARDYKEYLKLRQHFDVLNTIAERCARAQAGPDESGYDAALSQVSPQGHLFDAPQTIARCDSEFCPPIVHDYAKFGTWQERGSQSADERATAIWQDIVAAPSPVALDADRLGDLQAFIQRRSDEGGAAPVSG